MSKPFTQYLAHSRDAVKETSLLSLCTVRTKCLGREAVPWGPLLSQLPTVPQEGWDYLISSLPYMEMQLSFGSPLTIPSSSVASLATKGLSCKAPGSCYSSYPGNLGSGPDASALSLSSREQPKRHGK